MRMQPFDVTEEQYAEMREGSGGFCLGCREEAYGVEPDARKYTCGSCGEPKVYGIEELLIMGLVGLTG